MRDIIRWRSGMDKREMTMLQRTSGCSKRFNLADAGWPTRCRRRGWRLEAPLSIGLLALCLGLSSFWPAPAAAEPEPVTPCTAGDMIITFGMVVDCSIEVVGDQDVLRFAGTMNSVVVLSLFDATGNCGNGQCPVAQLFRPGSATSIATLGPGTDSQELLLPTSGTYTIRVAEHLNDQTVVYRIGLERLFPASPNVNPLVFGINSGSRTIDPVPDQDFYTFDAFQDAVITLTLGDLTGNCGNGQCPVASLFGPDQTLVTTLGPGGDSEDITLPQDGLYTVHLFEHVNDQTVGYNLNLQCLFPPPGHTMCGPIPPSVTCNGLTPTQPGTAGNDVLVGTIGNDVIAGLGGNDRISGLNGNDVICGDSDQGGTGSDTLLGGGGDDQLFGNAGVNILYGDAGNDALKGGKSRDGLFGGAGDDTLNAQGGDDALVGGAGNDVLQGGLGANDVCDKQAEDLTPQTGCEILDKP